LNKDLKHLAVVLLLAVATATGFVYLAKRKGYGLRVGEPAPSFSVSQPRGRAVSLESLRGQVVLVNLWASWCPPCLDEMPSLERLHRQLKALGLVVLGVSADRELEPAEAVVQKLGLTFSILHDPEAEVGRAYRATGYPETFLIDRRGVLRQIYVGPIEWDDPKVVARVREVLDQAN
jgi:peroxiredoxin